MDNIPRMPEEYKGEIIKGNGISKTETRRWTEPECDWVLQMKKDGYSYNQIAESVGRSPESTSIKVKRLWKERGGYNRHHLEAKEKANKAFIDEIKPITALDLYCGDSLQYQELKTTRNDKNRQYEADYNMDALKCLCKLYAEGQKYDFIDLDPYGSAFECFDLSIAMAKKGIAITLGEMGHKRYKRLDFVKRYYEIETFEDFTVENIIKKIQKIGERHKKQLEVWSVQRWTNIVRVYFKIKPYKITEQWEYRKKEGKNL
jgi:hypothetical protein